MCFCKVRVVERLLFANVAFAVFGYSNEPFPLVPLHHFEVCATDGPAVQAETDRTTKAARKVRF